MNRRLFFVVGAVGTLGLSQIGCGSGGAGFSSLLSGDLLLNTTAGQVVALRPDGTQRRVLAQNRLLLSASPDGKVLELERLERAVYQGRVLQGVGGEELAVEGISNGVAGIWSPDSQFLVCYRYGVTVPPSARANLSLVSRRGEVLQELLPSRSTDLTIAWLTPAQLFWSDATGSYRLPVVTGTSEKLTDQRYTLASPDGRLLFRGIAQGARFAVERLELATGTKTILLDELDLSPRLSWSRDGRYLLVSAGRAGLLAARIDSTSGSAEVFTLVSNLTNGQVVWSPDSQSFAYTWAQERGSEGDWPTFLEIHHSTGNLALAEEGTPAAWL